MRLFTTSEFHYLYYIRRGQVGYRISDYGLKHYLDTKDYFKFVDYF